MLCRSQELMKLMRNPLRIVFSVDKEGVHGLVAYCLALFVNCKQTMNN